MGPIDWIKTKAVAGVDGAVEWYMRQGFRRIASQLGGYGRGYTGRYFDEVTCMKISVVFGAVKIISEDCGSLPFFLYRKSADGKSREKAFDHPLYRVLHDAPNDELSAIDWRGAQTSHAAVTGDGYSRILRRSGRDRVVVGMELWMPSDVKQDRDNAGNLVYLHREGQVWKTYGIREVFHLRGFSWSGVKGYSLVDQAANALDLGMSAEEYAGRFFANDATPGVVLKYPKSMSPGEIQNAKKAWREAFAGMKDKHDVAVAHSGMEVEKLSFSPEESQLLSARTYFIQEVCRLFRMPPHKLAELTHATFSNVENQEISYYQNALRPWLVRWEQAVSRCCLTLEDIRSLYAEHEIAGLLRGDFLSQTVAFARMLEKGVYSVNEVRAMLNMNPIEGGDAHFIQLNMQSIADAAAGLAAAQNDQQAIAAADNVKVDTAKALMLHLEKSIQ